MQHVLLYLVDLYLWHLTHIQFVSSIIGVFHYFDVATRCENSQDDIQYTHFIVVNFKYFEDSLHMNVEINIVLCIRMKSMLTTKKENAEKRDMSPRTSNNVYLLRRAWRSWHEVNIQQAKGRLVLQSSFQPPVRLVETSCCWMNPRSTTHRSQLLINHDL